MRRLFERWFECEDGHITVGNNRKTKCGAELWQLDYIKGKRKGQWISKETKDEKSCSKLIVAEGEIPLELNYTTRWDYKICHAFLMGQRFDAEFIIDLQNEFNKIWKAMEKYGKDTGRDPERT